MPMYYSKTKPTDWAGRKASEDHQIPHEESIREPIRSGLVSHLEASTQSLENAISFDTEAPPPEPSH